VFFVWPNHPIQLRLLAYTNLTIDMHLLHTHHCRLDEIANLSLSQGTNAWTDTDNTVYTLTTAGMDGALQVLPVYLDHVLYPVITDSGYTTEVHHINGDGGDAGIV
jgi:hypothetical protein